VRDACVRGQSAALREVGTADSGSRTRALRGPREHRGARRRRGPRV